MLYLTGKYSVCIPLFIGNLQNTFLALSAIGMICRFSVKAIMNDSILSPLDGEIIDILTNNQTGQIQICARSHMIYRTMHVDR